MRKITVSLILILFYYISLPVFGQPAPQPGGAGQPGAQGGAGQPGGDAAQPQFPTKGYLTLETLEDFEEAEDWRARSTTPLGDTKVMKIVQRGDIRAADDENMRPPQEESLSANQDPLNPNHILGIKTFFWERGFDRVEVKPPHEYVIKGKARQFSVWVLGRNFNHMLSIKLRDYSGKVHKLPIGQLNFFGWRKMTVTVPGWLPQSTRYALLNRNLRFVSLFVTHDVHEPPGEFYFYVDGLKVLVDKAEQNYPGSEIRDNW